MKNLLTQIIIMMMIWGCSDAPETQHIPVVYSVEPEEVEFEFVEPVTEPAPLMFSAEEVRCLQENIFFEAATESIVGRRAVASVTLNRVAHPRFPSTICGVVKHAQLLSNGMPKRHKCQFSWYCDGRSDKPNLDNEFVRRVWDEIGLLADEMANGGAGDTVNGSLYYHATRITPKWDFNKLVVHETIGKHVFYVNAD